MLRFMDQVSLCNFDQYANTLEHSHLRSATKCASLAGVVLSNQHPLTTLIRTK